MNSIYLLLAAAGVTGAGALLCLILTIIRAVLKKRLRPSALPCVILLFLSFANCAGVFLMASKEPFLPWNAVPKQAFTEKDTTGLSDKDLFIENLTANPNVSPDAAGHTYDVLKDQLGFERITAEQNMKEMLFQVHADDYQLTVILNDRLYMVICGNYSLYQDQTVMYTKKDLEEQKIDAHDTLYYQMAKEAVSSDLKYPTTAKFCPIEDCQMAQSGELVVVTGYVDAKNSFNTLVRNSFTVELKIKDLDSQSFDIVYLNIEGNKTGEYVDLRQ